MGESYDARAELGNWSAPGYDTKTWATAVRAETNPRVKAVYSDAAGQRDIDLGFVAPPKMQAYSAPPIIVTQELATKSVAEPKPGVFVFDLGQNFAGLVRLKIKRAAGTQVRLRFGKMLHKDGSIMTENLRQARATDFDTLRGDPAVETTPVEFIDTYFLALDCMLMAEMATALGRPLEAATYRARRAKTHAAFTKTYAKPEGTLTVETQSAYVLALEAGLIAEKQIPATVATLVAKIAKNDYRMATGFLGTKSLLPVLSNYGQHDLAVRLFQSRKFPSWGYEVSNGANSVWERWDSYTVEHGFNGANGKQNSAMNSFSHYAFGAVMEWGYRVLAGIDTERAGYRNIVIMPRPPTPGSNPDQTPINWVKAHYDSINGRIASAWKPEKGVFTLDVTIPANTTASIFLPNATAARTTEGGAPLGAIATAKIAGIRAVETAGDSLAVSVGAGTYRFAVRGAGP